MTVWWRWCCEAHTYNLPRCSLCSCTVQCDTHEDGVCCAYVCLSLLALTALSLLRPFNYLVEVRRTKDAGTDIRRINKGCPIALYLALRGLSANMDATIRRLSSASFHPSHSQSAHDIRRTLKERKNHFVSRRLLLSSS